MKERTAKQELAIQVVRSAVHDWRRSYEDWISSLENMRLALRRAVEAGVSQSALAREVGWPRQRVNEILNG